MKIEASQPGTHRLRQKTTASVNTLGRRAANAARVVDSFCLRPVTTNGSLAARTGLSQPTTGRLLAGLQQLGIVAEMTGQRRNRVFCFRDYYNLFLSSPAIKPPQRRARKPAAQTPADD